MKSWNYKVNLFDKKCSSIKFFQLNSNAFRLLVYSSLWNINCWFRSRLGVSCIELNPGSLLIYRPRWGSGAFPLQVPFYNPFKSHWLPVHGKLNRCGLCNGVWYFHLLFLFEVNYYQLLSAAKKGRYRFKTIAHSTDDDVEILYWCFFMY